MTATTDFGNVIRGIAIGDAWGDPNEFRKLVDLTKNNERGPGLPKELRITDDTQMSLYLADALDLTRNGTMDETKQAIILAYLEYYDDPDNNRAPGTTVMGSLGSLKWKAKTGWDWKTATNRTSDGSGTVMRAAPVAFVREDDWVGIAAFQAAVTHGAANAIAASILNVAVLRGMLQGYVKPGEAVAWAKTMADDPEDWGLLDTGNWLEDFYVPNGLESGFRELARLLGKAEEALPEMAEKPWAFRNDPSNMIWMGGGWRAHETLVIALMAVDMLPNDPWLALRRAVTSDGDSDTIGAVAGGLIGAASAAGLYPGFENEFIDAWDTELRDSFEPRYVAWIENEADDYVFSGEFDEFDAPEEEGVAVEVTVAEEPEQDPKVLEFKRLPHWVKRLLS